MSLESDLTLQKYRVLADENGKPLILGQGAMGTAYMAVDPFLDRKVVLKLIKQELLSDDTVRKRFLREAKAVAALQHPNVAGIFEFCEEDDMVFYAMEFIAGRNLDQVVKEDGPLDVEPALRIARKVALALKAAEAKHLVHRDIKPSNIMLQDSPTGGEPAVKLIDFGLAKALTAEAGDGLMLTNQGFVGTPVFASPEQLEEKEVDIRSDIYSLGITLWYTIRGKAPFQATSLAGLIRAHLSEVPPFDELAEVEPEPVCELLKRMLAKSPADRQENAAMLLEEIEDCLEKIGASLESSLELPNAPIAEPPPHEMAEPEHEVQDEPVPDEEHRFEILDVIWRDPWGPVYHGREIETGESVVLHEVRADLLNDPRRAAELEEFIGRAGNLEHPNILYYESIEYGAPGGPGYIIGEYWVGIRLKDIIDARGRVDLTEALTLLDGVIDAADFCALKGFRDPDLDPFRVILPIPIDPAISTATETIAAMPISEWPELRPMIVPFSFENVLGQTGKGTAVGEVIHSERTYVQRIALLFYQLLGGSPADLKRNRYKKLPEAGAGVNRALKSCLSSNAFSTGAELRDALAGKEAPGTAGTAPVRKKRGKSRSILKPVAAAVLALAVAGGVFAAVQKGWIGGNRGPRVAPDEITVTPEVKSGVIGGLSVTGDVLSNDGGSSRRGNLAVSMVNGEASNVGSSVAGDFGVITLKADGNYTYTFAPSMPGGKLPALGETGREVFEYTVSDGKASATTSLTILIAIEKPPLPEYRQEDVYAGIHFEMLPEWYCRALQIDSGALVTGVLDDSPAAMNKILPGSIVTRWNGKALGDSLRTNRDSMVKEGPGSALELTLLVNGAEEDGFEEKKIRLTLGRWLRGEGEGESAGDDAIWDLSAADIARAAPDDAPRERWEAAWKKDVFADPGALAELTSIYRDAAALHAENKELHPNLGAAAKRYEALEAELSVARKANVTREVMALVVQAMHGRVSAMRQLGEAYVDALPEAGEEVAERAAEWLKKASEAGDAKAAQSLEKMKEIPLTADDPIVKAPDDEIDEFIKTFAYDEAKALLERDYPDAEKAKAMYLTRLRAAYEKQRAGEDLVRAANILEEFDRSLHTGGEPDRGALRFLFDEYDDLEDEEGAPKVLEELVSLDEPDPELLFVYASAHEEGSYFKKNDAKALAYFEKARAAGYQPATAVDEAIERLKTGIGKVARIGVDFLNSEGIVMGYGGKTSKGNNHFWMSKESISTTSAFRARLTSADGSAGKLPQGITVNVPAGKTVAAEGKEYAYYTSISNSRKLVLVPRWEREDSLVTEKPKTPEELKREEMLAEEAEKKREEEEKMKTEVTVAAPTGSFTNAAGIHMTRKPKSANGNPFWESTTVPGSGGMTPEQFCVKLTRNERLAGRLPAGHIYTRSRVNPGKVVLLNASAEGLMDYSTAPVAQWVKGSANQVISPYTGKQLTVSGQPWTVQREGSRYFLLPSRDHVSSSKPSLVNVAPEPPPVEAPVVRAEVVANLRPPPEPPKAVDLGSKSFTNSRGMHMEYRPKSDQGNPFWRSTGSARASGDALNRLCVQLSYNERRSGRIPAGYVYAPASGGSGKLVLHHAAREGSPDYGSMSLGTYAPGGEVISPYTGKKLRVSGQVQPWSLVREGGNTFILPPR